ncbi:MAG: LssY C-terminal domain-containing protein [Candidatus Sulfotelmatobacter sp.]
MVRNLAVCTLTGLFFCAFAAFGQSGARDFSYIISTTQAWTDTGLDLQTGDVLQIFASGAASSAPDRHAVSGMGCDPQGEPAGSPSSGLPLPSAPAGALIVRLHAQGAAPLLVGSGSELRIEEPSHLYLGVNAAAVPPCQGSFLVKVHRASAGGAGTSNASASSVPAQEALTPSSATAATSNSATPTSSSASADSKTRGEQLKSQLGTAAQIFMQGQFGMGKSETGANGAANAASGGSGEAAAPALKLSDAPLDADLRKDIDGLPRRVNDQFKNLGDMVNFVIVGSQPDVQAALAAANWHPADVGDKKAVLSAIESTFENKDYLQMPMSTLYLFGRAQDFGYEMAEPIAMVASRHHFRIWKAPVTWKGKEIWVGAGTHDVGFAKDKRNGSVTHKIDPKVDGERDNIGSSLQKASKVRSLSYYLPPNPVQDAKNATGDGYQSDGRLLVVLLQ